jgi:hypothetical protein
LPDTTAASRRIRVEPSVERLLEGTQDREPWKTADSLSGSRLWRVRIDGVPHVLKHVVVDDDWIMRATGDLHCRQLTLLTSAMLDRLPECIDHTIVAVAPAMSDTGHRGAMLLMRDVSEAMVPSGSSPIDLALHRSFLDHMARMHAAYWGFRDELELMPLPHHYIFLTPTMASLERAAGRGDPVPPAVAEGWERLHRDFPRTAAALIALADDPWPLVTAVHRGPQTLIHADWKLGNLGSAEGRTVLLDWDRCGEAPPLVDLAWYLGVNCDRLPESKEDAIAAYRAALETEGRDTTGWWDDALAAALAGGFLQLAWTKTGDVAEFAWWSDRLDAWLATR